MEKVRDMNKTIFYENLMMTIHEIMDTKNVGNRLLTVEEAVKIVACNSPFVPVWINISLNKIKGEKLVFNFETSLRFRKPSLLRNAETGHPPFKAII